MFPHGIEAKFIRLYPQTWVKNIALKMELFGCSQPVSNSQNIASTTPMTTPVPTTTSSVGLNQNFFDQKYGEIKLIEDLLSNVNQDSLTDEEKEQLFITIEMLKYLKNSFKQYKAELDELGVLSETSLVNLLDEITKIHEIKKVITSLLSNSQSSQEYAKIIDVNNNLIQTISEFIKNSQTQDSGITFFKKSVNKVNTIEGTLQGMNLSMLPPSDHAELQSIREHFKTIKELFDTLDNELITNQQLSTESIKNLKQKIEELNKIRDLISNWQGQSKDKEKINKIDQDLSVLIYSLNIYKDTSGEQYLSKINYIGKNMTTESEKFAQLVSSGLIENKIDPIVSKQIKQSYDKLSYFASQLETHTSEDVEQLEMLTKNVQNELMLLEQIIDANRLNGKISGLLLASLDKQYAKLEELNSILLSLISNKATSVKNKPDFFTEVKEEIVSINDMLENVIEETEPEDQKFWKLLEMIKSMTKTIAELEDYKRLTQEKGQLDHQAITKLQEEIKRLEKVRKELESSEFQQSFSIATITVINQIKIKSELVINNLVTYIKDNDKTADTGKCI